MVNVCFFSGDITRVGGTERVGSLIASELAKKHLYKIFILSLSEGEEHPFFPLDDQIIRNALFDRKVNGKRDLFRIINRLVTFINTNKIDIIIDIDCILDIFSVPAKLFTKVKIISWEHFKFDETLGVPYRKYARFLAARYANYIIVLSEQDKMKYQNTYKIHNQIDCVYNPVVIPKGDVLYNLESKTLISVGRLSFIKGFDLLIDVAKLIFKRHPDWKWVIIGDGQEKENLTNKIKLNNLQNNIFLEGFRKNVNDYYRDSSIYVLTSRSEGFPIVLTEALSYKLPIVTFKCSDVITEIVKDNINGFVVEDFGIDEMANKICYLIENKDIREEMSNNTNNAINKFSLHTIVNKWIGIIDKVNNA